MRKWQLPNHISLSFSWYGDGGRVYRVYAYKKKSILAQFTTQNDLPYALICQCPSQYLYFCTIYYSKWLTVCSYLPLSLTVSLFLSPDGMVAILLTNQECQNFLVHYFSVCSRMQALRSPLYISRRPLTSLFNHGNHIHCFMWYVIICPK